MDTCNFISQQISATLSYNNAVAADELTTYEEFAEFILVFQMTTAAKGSRFCLRINSERLCHQRAFLMLQITNHVTTMPVNYWLIQL